MSHQTHKTSADFTEHARGLFVKAGLSFTDQRRIITNVIYESSDHPDIDEIYLRARRSDNGIGIATVYRTVGILVDLGIIAKLSFNDGKYRYEDAGLASHHEHIIDIETSEVIEFSNDIIKDLIGKIAHEHGYELVNHKLDLYCKKNTKY